MSDDGKPALYARILAPLVRPFPNFDLSFLRSLRRRAVERLALREGDRVLDAGCGPGGSFPYLEAALPKGSIVGLEISPALAASARRRIEVNRWQNVEVVVGDARNVELEGSFDSLLMMGAPDVYASPEALRNLGKRMKPRASFVAFGAKLTRNPLGKALNPVFEASFSLGTSVSTPKLELEPWRVLEQEFGPVEVEELWLGWMFMAWGRKKK